MKFLHECQADATAYLVYQVCPGHLLKPAELLKDLHTGRVREIVPDWDGALEDSPA